MTSPAANAHGSRHLHARLLAAFARTVKPRVFFIRKDGA